MSARERLNRLVAQRDALELEADAIASELNSPGVNNEPPAGIKTSLIDKEGFPRGDIDLFNVRAKRQRLAVINTDHKTLMSEIEKTLHLVHSELPAVDELRSALKNSTTSNEVITTLSKAFAIIDENWKQVQPQKQGSSTAMSSSRLGKSPHRPLTLLMPYPLW
jgi:Nas2 N_terminal domain